MHEEIIIAGFGGQGVLLAGKLLCIAGMNENKHVSHIPSYGAEMRGGTANCSVIISNEQVASPVVESPTIVLALNSPSVVKFLPKIRKGGTLIYNSSLIKDEPQKDGITIFKIPANHISEDNGSNRSANMAMIGFLLKLKSGILKIESLIKALDIGISARNKKFNPANEKIINAGYNFS